MVGKRSRRGLHRDFATGFGLVPGGGGEAGPTGSRWSYGVSSASSSSPILSFRINGARRSIPGLCRR